MPTKIPPASKSSRGWPMDCVEAVPPRADTPVATDSAATKPKPLPELGDAVNVYTSAGLVQGWVSKLPTRPHPIRNGETGQRFAIVVTAHVEVSTAHGRYNIDPADWTFDPVKGWIGTPFNPQSIH